MKEILLDDNNLTQFAFRFLRQVMFGEESIKMVPDALEKRLARLRELEAMRKKSDASDDAAGK
jgi:hypothetical protein